MGFWKFKKKEVKSVEPVNHVQILSDNLKVSFSRIRSDIEIVRNWLNGMRDKDQDQDRRINEISNKVDELGEVLTYMQKSQHRLREEVLRISMPAEKPAVERIATPQRETVNTEPVKVRVPEQTKESETNTHADLFESLTETQQALFLRLGTLIKESGQEWIPLKFLAQEIYPDKEYGKVRSTISEYVDVLGEFNLLDKKRRGKQSYVTLSKKGKAFFEQNKKSEDIEVKKKKKN